MMEWKDIRLAPKETLVLAWGDNWRFKDMAIVFVHNKYNGHDGVITENGRCGVPYQIGEKGAPTKYCELPEPPK